MAALRPGQRFAGPPVLLLGMESQRHDGGFQPRSDSCEGARGRIRAAAVARWRTHGESRQVGKRAESGFGSVSAGGSSRSPKLNMKMPPRQVISRLAWSRKDTPAGSLLHSVHWFF